MYNYNTNYDGQIITQVEETTFLGLILDSHISWKAHIEKICNKLNKFVFVLYSLKKTASQKTVLLTYHGYVTSTLLYGLILWGNSTDWHRAFLVQKKCIRAIGGIPPWESCKSLFKKFKLLTLPSLYILECAKFVRHNSHIFQKASDRLPRLTRDPERLVIPRTARTTLYQKNCYYMCIKIYNKLPRAIKNTTNRVFFNSLKTWLISKAFYSVTELFN